LEKRRWKGTSASGQQQINTIVMWGRLQPITRHMDCHCIVDLRIAQASHGEEVDGGGDHNEAM
jgi:hypothetical protein